MSRDRPRSVSAGTGSGSWRARRGKALGGLGLWRAWGAVPPAENRVGAFLPGGGNYGGPGP